VNIGRRDIIEIEIGKRIDGARDLFEFDVWLMGHHITRIDNVAYLKSVIAQAEDDLIKNRDLNTFSKYLQGMSAQEAHKFILSTRDTESESFDIENDQIYPNQQILNWGPNTDNVVCFLVPLDRLTYVTIQYCDTAGEAGVIFTGKIDLSFFNKAIEEFIERGANKI
jgi:hypothetical protein